MTERKIPADMQERLRELSLQWHVDVQVLAAAYRLGLSQREAQPLPLPQGELSSDLRQLAMDMGPFWAGVLDSAAMHLDQHAQREAQLRAKVTDFIEREQSVAEGLQQIAGHHTQQACGMSLLALLRRLNALFTPQEPEP